MDQSRGSYDVRPETYCCICRIYDRVSSDYRTDLLCPVCKKLSQDESIWKSSEESAQITAGRKIKDGA